jgi:hypothetical protein
MRHLEVHVLAEGELSAMVERIAVRELDPYTAADELLTRALGTGAMTVETRRDKR